MNEKFGKALTATIERLSKKVSIMTLGSKPMSEAQVISTGSLGLDLALGIHGYPAGRIVEISGPESSGKTTLALHAIAECHRQGHHCAFIDVEHALDPEYAKKLGVNTDELIFSQPDNGEEALSIVDELASTGKVRLIVVDSVAALVPKMESEGEMEDNQVGAQARLMGKGLRKITGTISKADCLVIFINQIRQKIGVTFGNPETTPGGMALKFACSIRLDIRRIGSIKDTNGKDIGNKVKVKVTKNKMAPPFKITEFDIMYGMGISRNGEIVDMAIDRSLIKKTGAWYIIGKYKMQGRESAVQFLRDNTHIAEFLAQAILKISTGNIPENFIEITCKTLMEMQEVSTSDAKIKPTVNDSKEEEDDNSTVAPDEDDTSLEDEDEDF